MAAGSSAALTANITPGVSPASTGIAVACNLTAIGGSASFNLPNTSGNTYAAALLGACPYSGEYIRPAMHRDRPGRPQRQLQHSLVVTSSSTPPTATGTATPNPVTAGNSVSLSATPVSGANPASASFTLACNLTAIGGGASVALPANYLVPGGHQRSGVLAALHGTDDVRAPPGSTSASPCRRRRPAFTRFRRSTDRARRRPWAEFR